MKMHILFILFFLAHVPSANSSDLRTFVKEHYLVRDEDYDFLPKGQFNASGQMAEIDLQANIKSQSTMSWEYLYFDDGLFKLLYKANDEFEIEKISQRGNKEFHAIIENVKRKLSIKYPGIPNELIFDKVVRSKKRDFVFFYVNRIEKKSREFNINDQYDTPRKYYYGFAIIDSGQVFFSEKEVVPQKTDPETGKYFRSVWDVFHYSGHEYLLVLRRSYETYAFEIFAHEKGGYRKVDDFVFGGL